MADNNNLNFENDIPVGDATVETRNAEETVNIEDTEILTPEEIISDNMDELELLKEELARQKDGNLRILAEYDNYRKRTIKEKESLYKNAVADTMEKLLPVYDNLLRACSAADADEGIAMIFRQTEEIFLKVGVTAYGAPGDSFDPDFFEAVAHEDNPDYGENQVLEVLIKGFKYGDKVIRHAVVKTVN